VAISINNIKPSSKISKKPVGGGPGLSFIQKTIGDDTYLVLAQSQVQLEDEFSNLYYTVQNQSNIFLQPPFDPAALLGFAQTNNVLNQCIEAMEVNIDATGHEFVPSHVADALVAKARAEWEAHASKIKAQQTKEKLDHRNATALAYHAASQAPAPAVTDGSNNPTAEPAEIPVDLPAPLMAQPDLVKPEFGNGIDPDELLRAKDFFNEPYPGLSFNKIRRKLRREMETVGYAYLEVLRNLNGDIVALRNIETHNTRMVKLDAPILVEKEITRGEQVIKLQLWERQRRFAQRVAMKQLVYYREFGTARHVDRNTGKWEVPDMPGQPGNVVAPENRGTELIMFGVHPDSTTPYMVPRWINQLPSVIGSRKAEELNLEFLDAGGMPPAIIFIQGGTLAKDASDQLKMYLSGKNKNKHRAVVVEAQSSSGSLESAGSVQVKVERFGGDKMNDAMFQKYDALTEEHIRVGFRIPPLFLGKPADYNMATAVTAYMVAEEQVFQVERSSFDETLNRTIMAELGFKTLRFKSLPITLTDATSQISALTQAKGTVTNESFVDAINKITGFEMDASAQPATPAESGGAPPPPGPHTPPKAPVKAPTPASHGDTPGGGVNTDKGSIGEDNDSAQPEGDPAASKTASELVELAQDYLSLKGLSQKREISDARSNAIKSEVLQLSRQDRKSFDSLVAAYTFGSGEPDLVNIASHICDH
jgi:PBSX family phage portal protein